VTRTAIALGSNVGDRLANMRFAVEKLSELGSLVAVSSLYETAPVGGPDQPDYLNAVVVVDVDRAPLDLLSDLNAIEAAAQRVRRERWGPRTLDLDIVAHDDRPVSLPQLEIPHARAAERRFVLEPLCEVWPQAVVSPQLEACDALALVGRQDVSRWHGDWTTGLPGHGPAAIRWVGAQIALLAVWLIVILISISSPVTTLRWSIGGSVLGIGLLLGASAVSALGHELTPYPQPRQGAQLVAHGPYRVVRHPIYGAVALGLAGTSIVAGSWWAFIVSLLVAFFFSVKSDREERALLIGVPGYSDYRHRVRRRMIPFVW
jgi:2-amino-4-hydroxy-6-hydroxymethyldihydropteridine diphosphokinase